MNSQFDIELLVTQHKRTDFACGNVALDNYFQKQVSQDVHRRVAKCYVAVDTTNNDIAGYYTLSASSMALPDVPEPLRKHLPRYPTVPVALLGRFAVSQKYQGQGLGAAFLSDALERAKTSALAAFAIIVVAKDETAKNFYLHYGFTAYGSLPLHLILGLG
jgi:GNAT superfamily N-acetyltransferase